MCVCDTLEVKFIYQTEIQRERKKKCKNIDGNNMKNDKTC